MKFLALQHVAHESLGYIGEYAREKHIQLDIVELWKPYIIPDPTGYDLIIILGGPMGVYDDYPSKNDELAFIRKYIDTLPLLGICLGSQLIAYALGAEVEPNPGGKEIGYYDIELTEEGRNSNALKGFDSSLRALEWHGDAFELPLGATRLAQTPICPNQAFSYKRSHGFLFHLEFTYEMVQRLIEKHRVWTHTNFDLNEQVLLAEAGQIAPLMKKLSYQLLNNLLEVEK